MQLGTSPAGIRGHNERLILSLIRAFGPLPRSDLARLTGLSAQAVTNISRGLIAGGYLDDGDPVRGKVGQPSRPLALRPDGAWFAGLKIGRRSTELALLDFAGQLVGERSQIYDMPTPDLVLAFLQRALPDLAQLIPPDRRDRLMGLGVAMPFFLWDWGAGMEGWRDIDPAPALSAATGLPVLVENDASCACGAELMFGAADLPADFLHVYVGHFGGGGLVLDGRLRMGPHRNAGALGSMPVPDAGGRIRQLLDLASISTLEARLGRVLPRDDAAWDVPPELAAAWAAEAGRAIAFAAVTAAAVVDLGAVVIDGAMPAALRRDLVAATGAAMAALPMAGLHPPVLREGTLGRAARSLGAAALPLAEGFGPLGGGFALPLARSDRG
ncbi:ROK family transcriptional regulator [Paracoccus sp. p4-l81]|uniref:ROK family transcriptional regulator n=1 Tax=unclassified Paracoccus (in: a-proteobacteria) TaxID=2688777 RepID=UPI0035B8C58D